ncbi:U3-containing 90S pre-ribosomal complex subunit-domain containing protein [Dipodascopsis uninucleata]
MKRKELVKVGGDDLDDGLEYTLDDLDTVDDDGVVIDPSEIALNSSSSDEEGADSTEARTKGGVDTSESKALKRKKGKERMALKKRRRMELELTVKKNISVTEPSIIADYMIKRARLWHPKLSPIELDDMFSIPATNVLDVSSFGMDRLLENFDKFLGYTCKKINMEEAPLQKGSPYVIVLCISAIRVCDVRRAIPKQIKSLKIMSKNSLAADCKTLEGYSTSVVITTPQRALSIADKGSLNCDNLRIVIVDSSFLDPKMRTVLDDIPETLTALKRFLVATSGTAKIALF